MENIWDLLLSVYYKETTEFPKFFKHTYGKIYRTYIKVSSVEIVTEKEYDEDLKKYCNVLSTKSILNIEYVEIDTSSYENSLTFTGKMTYDELVNKYFDGFLTDRISSEEEFNQALNIVNSITSMSNIIKEKLNKLETFNRS